MIKLLILLGLSTVAFGASLRGYNERISNGHATDIRGAKFYAFFNCGGILCGATLVTTNRLITAAHCVRECRAENLVISVGMNSRAEIDNGSADQYRATAVHMHPSETETSGLNYDIAVIYLDGDVRVTETVEPISYALSPAPLNDYVTCFGYGGTETGQGADVLQRSYFLTKRYEGNKLITNAEQTSVRPGDSGGPCTYNNQLTGVISAMISVGDEVVENILVNTGTDEILAFLRSHGL
ncbi:snake venom serine protease HS112-like [Onthophagus taurus]|uniref:snake venom serine protease HS112-like n=1 Tax=Onthophagus taurus TaxID=166361 RepID=UPI000C1FDF06|nr:snake venom serine protease HS112-like [Onthophagus taurus]